MTFQGHFGDLLAVVTLSAQLTRSLPAIYKLLVLKSGSLISHLLPDPGKGLDRISLRVAMGQNCGGHPVCLRSTTRRRRRQWQISSLVRLRLVKILAAYPALAHATLALFSNSGFGFQ